MKRIDYASCFLLGVAALVSRIPLIERYQSFWDGPQYTIGIVSYSFEQHTPAAPGYPYFIGLGKLFNFFIHDPHASLVAVTVLASVTGAITLYIVGMKMLSRFVGLTAAIIFLTGSTFYFFSIAPHSYDLLITTTTLLAYSVYRIFIQKKQEGLFLGLAIGICIGVRPQEIMQISPLFLLGFLMLAVKEKIKASIIFVLVTLSWFIPVTLAVGFTGYFVHSATLANTSVSNGSVLQHAESMIKGFLLSFGIAPGFLIYYVKKRKQVKKVFLMKNRIIVFYAAWIVPGVLYNLLIRSDAVGYQFSYLSAILFLISYAIWQSTRHKRLLYLTALTCVAVFNLYWFFYDRDPTFIKPYRPVSYHYSELRKNDIKIGGKVEFIQENFDPQSTLIITSTDYWRQYMYHLKNFNIISPAGLTTKEKQFVHEEFQAFEWKMKKAENKNFSISIPDRIKIVLFTDDNAQSWMKNYSAKTYKLPGNSGVTTIEVKTGDTLKYNYHNAFIEK